MPVHGDARSPLAGVFSLLALWFVSAMNRGRQPKRLAAWLIFAYGLVFSVLGIDLAMALDPHWYSALFGVYFFISGLYLAAAGWTLATVLVDRRGDGGSVERSIQADHHLQHADGVHDVLAAVRDLV